MESDHTTKLKALFLNKLTTEYSAKGMPVPVPLPMPIGPVEVEFVLGHVHHFSFSHEFSLSFRYAHIHGGYFCERRFYQRGFNGTSDVLVQKIVTASDAIREWLQVITLACNIYGEPDPKTTALCIVAHGGQFPESMMDLSPAQLAVIGQMLEAAKDQDLPNGEAAGSATSPGNDQPMPPTEPTPPETGFPA